MAKSSKKKLVKFLLLGLGGLFLVLLALGISFYFTFLNRIYPLVYIGDQNISAKTLLQARQSLDSILKERTQRPLTFTQEGRSYSIDLTSLSSIDTERLTKEAFSFGHTRFYFSPVHLKLISALDPNTNLQIQQIAKALDQPPVNATLSVSGEEISVSPSQDGLIIDQDAFSKDLLNYINTGKAPSSELPLKKEAPKLTYEDALAIKQELESIKTAPIPLTFKDKNYTLDLSTILNLVDLENTKSILISGEFFGNTLTLASASLGGSNITATKFSLNQKKLADYLNALAKDINRGVKEPSLNYDAKANGGKGKVTEFQPPEEGYTLNISKASDLINNRLASSDFRAITLPVDITPPQNKLVNDLGIKELLAEGVSHFSHSIPNRVWNVSLAASRINGTLVPPQGIFSFNDSIGEVSGASGYREAYVISGGKTVLDDGGGVCQDSTTLFRAVLKAGLPIVSRTAHAYRVGYYEQDSPPGIDATVFSPSVDFKFKNDTGAYILVQTRIEGETLYYDLYGTPDGRLATVTTPVILSTTPALPDVHQDDPTLPKGTVKQIDFAVGGANVVFSRTVTRGGQTLIQETYRSNYRPWANIYLMGTKEG